MVMITLYAKQKKRHRCTERTFGLCGRRRLYFHFSLSCTGEGNGNPCQYSCLENPGDGGAWWADAQSRTQLKRLSSSSNIPLYGYIPYFKNQVMAFIYQLMDIWFVSIFGYYENCCYFAYLLALIECVCVCVFFRDFHIQYCVICKWRWFYFFPT